MNKINEIINKNAKQIIDELKEKGYDEAETITTCYTAIIVVVLKKLNKNNLKGALTLLDRSNELVKKHVIEYYDKVVK